MLALLPALGLTTALAGTPDAEVRLSARDYWYHRTLADVRIVADEGGELVGEVQSKHGPQRFRIARHDLDAPQMRRDGYLRGLESLVAVVRHGDTATKVAAARARLAHLTGEDFATADDWTRWLDAHRASVGLPAELEAPPAPARRDDG